MRIRKDHLDFQMRYFANPAVVASVQRQYTFQGCVHRASGKIGRLSRFRRRHEEKNYAIVAKLADAHASGACGVTPVLVQLQSVAIVQVLEEFRGQLLAPR